MREINAHMLIVFGILGAISIVVVAIRATRKIDADDGGNNPSPEPAPDGKSITIGARTYGLHTATARLGSAHWVLSLPVGAPHTFSVQREDGLESLIDHLGVMTKVDTGNEHYDEEFEIRSKDASWTRTFFSDPEHRRLVQALFGLDASTVILSNGRVQACFEEQAALAEGGPALSELAAALGA
jgi:hypothetical protein